MSGAELLFPSQLLLPVAEEITLKNLKSVVGGPMLIICGLILVGCAPTRFDRTQDRNDLDRLIEQVSALEAAAGQPAPECDCDTSAIEAQLAELEAQIGATNQRIDRVLEDVAAK